VAAHRRGERLSPLVAARGGDASATPVKTIPDAERTEDRPDLDLAVGARGHRRQRAGVAQVPRLEHVRARHGSFVSANGPLSVTAPVTRPTQSRQVRVFWPPYDLTA
jgi:hypothetical protein